MKYTVVEAHQSSYPNPIRFQKGDRLLIGIQKSEFQGWLWVTTADGNQCWASAQHLKIDSGRQATATQDYTAAELDSCIGDALHLHYELNGWGWVENENATCGWVPIETIRAVSPKAGDQPRPGKTKREIKS